MLKKRAAEPLESPGLTFKKRCLTFNAGGGSPLAQKCVLGVARTFDENTVDNLLFSGRIQGTKRSRTESYDSGSPSRDPSALSFKKQCYEEQHKPSITDIRREAHAKLRKAEALTRDLQETVGNQYREIHRLNNENRILKSGIRALHKQRDESMSQHRRNEMIVQDQNRKIKQLEQSLHALRAHIAQGRCGPSVSSAGWGGGSGPVY